MNNSNFIANRSVKSIGSKTFLYVIQRETRKKRERKREREREREKIVYTLFQ